MAATEQKKSYAVIKNFKGINTKANRTAIGEDEFAWLENVMPIGSGNIKTVPNYVTVTDSGGNAVAFANTVSVLASTNINVSDYILAAEADGRMEYFNITNSTKANVAVTGTFSSSGISTAQYKNERVMIGDPDKGLYTWDAANLVTIGSVGTIGITNAGSGYLFAPTVTISAPSAGGVQATAVCSVNVGTGRVIDTKIANGGTGYTTPPTVTFGASQTVGGVTATGYAVTTGGVITQIVIVNTGSGYTSAPSVTVTNNGAGSGASITSVISSGGINFVSITNAGSGYNSAPTITFSGGSGSGAAAIAQLATFKPGTVTVLVTNGGAGYTNSANTVVTFTGGGGANAAATAIISGNVVTQVVMTNVGSGYTSTPTVTITGGGATANATATAVVNLDQIVDVATFSGRVWVAAGRTVYYSAAGTYSDFTSVSAGAVVLTDSTLHGNIKAILSANNFLYVFGDDSINVFSDVRVDTTGATLFTNSNLSASIGTKRIYAIFPYFRSVLFLNDYGIYALVGSTTSKISDQLDGIFPYIDFTQPVSGGQALVNNILCAVFSFTYNDPLTSTARQIQAVFFEKKWFITSQGAISYVTSVPVSGTINLYSNISTGLYRMYASSTSAIASTIRTALLPMGDNIRTKQALKFGIEVSANAGSGITVTTDSETSSSPSVTLFNSATWINNLGVAVSWINNSSQAVIWTLGGNYYLYKSDAQQYGKYLGLTVTTTAPGLVFNTFEFEHELRVRF